MPAERVGSECAPLGGPAAIQLEVTKCLIPRGCYYSVPHGEQMEPGDMEPLASVSPSSAGGETMEETARLN